MVPSLSIRVLVSCWYAAIGRTPYSCISTRHWDSYREWRYHTLLMYNCVLLKMSTWYSKRVEESNNIWRINNIQCITLVVLYGQFMMHGQRNIKLFHLIFFFFFTMAQKPPVGHGLLIVKDAWSLSDTPYLVGLLWMSDQPDAETSTWQHTTLIRDRLSCPKWDSNPQSQQASGHRPTP